MERKAYSERGGLDNYFAPRPPPLVGLVAHVKVLTGHVEECSGCEVGRPLRVFLGTPRDVGRAVIDLQGVHENDPVGADRRHPLL